MLSPEKLRIIDPSLKDNSEEEIIKIRDSLYELGHLIFDDWLDKKAGSKYPDGVLQRFRKSNKM